MAMRRAHALLDAVGSRGPDTKIAVHVAEMAVVFDEAGAQIDAESARPASAVCESLIGAAPPGAIVVSDQAARFLERRFSLVASGPGLRLVGHERSGLGVAGQMTRFVGRENDLRFLESRVAVAERGHGQVLGIAGEAGIGKSRLLRELRQSLRGQAVTVLRGHCLPYGRSIPYFLVLRILRQALRISETDAPRKVTERVSRALRELQMDVACRPFLLRLLGVRDGAGNLAVLSDEAIKTGTLDVLRQMLLNGSRVQPIVYVTEDLHWIDRASEDVAAFLVDHLADARILLIATYRAGYRPPWADRSYATQIALQPLSDADGLALVRSISPGASLPDGLARAIVKRAEGNPFFLEELTRVGWDGSDGHDELAIPETVQDVVRARLNRLAEPARRLLQTVAVLGREFSPALAAKVWGAPVEPELAGLVRVEFLREESRGGERLYVFKHGLMHEVAYDAVPPDERRALHENAARAVSEVYAERVGEAYEQLAYHYSRADDDPRAVEYLTLSAERAARSYAHEEAVRALQQALRHAARLPAAEHTEPLLDVALRLASSLIPLGRFQDALDLLLQHEERLERFDRPALAGRYYFLVGRAASFLGNYERAASAAQRAIAEATRCGDATTTGKAYSVLAMDAPMSGHTREGIEFAQRAIALLDGTSERWWLGHTHWALGLNYTQIGEFVAALEAEGKAYAIGEAMGDPRLQTYASWVTGFIYAVAGEAGAAIDACRRALDRAPDPFNREIARGFVGYVHLENGEPATAIALLERAMQRLGEFRYRPFQGWFAVFLAEALRQGQELEKALDVVQQGLVISRDSGFQIGVGWAQQVLARIAHQRGNVIAATAYLAQARETFTALHSRYELGRTSSDMALVAHTAGDRAGAVMHLNAAHQVFVALHIPKYIERVSRLAHDLGISLRPQA
jgi:tetratricopeptide (TPR) repeat protein